MARRIGAAGLELVKKFEGFRGKWYRDPVGIWTVCYGHTDAAGHPFHADTKGKTFSEAEGSLILRADLQKYADAVSRAVKVPLNDNQFDALVSWCYNVGPGAMAKSTLVRKLNAGDYDAVPSELAKWNKAGGKAMKGLTRRRAAEAELWRRSAPPAPVPFPPLPEPPKPAPARPEPNAGGFLAVIIRILKAIFRGGQK